MDPSTLKAAADVGGWVFAAVAIATILVWHLRQIATAALVPGTLLTRSLDQNDRLLAAMTQLSSSVETLTGRTTDSMRELRDDITELRRLLTTRGG